MKEERDEETDEVIAEAQNVGPRQSENGQSVPVILVQIRPQISISFEK